MDEYDRQVRNQFQVRLTRIVAGAMKQCRDAHGQVDAGSVAKRVAAELWGLASPKGHPHGGRFLRHLRGQLGWTLRGMAEALQAEASDLREWENGSPPPEILQRATRLVQAELSRQRQDLADQSDPRPHLPEDRKAEVDIGPRRATLSPG